MSKLFYCLYRKNLNVIIVYNSSDLGPLFAIFILDFISLDFTPRFCVIKKITNFRLKLLWDVKSNLVFFATEIATEVGLVLT